MAENLDVIFRPGPTMLRVGLKAHALLAAGMLILSSNAPAEVLADPTRPPDPQALRGSAPAGPVLQSVLISPSRRLAVIDGQTVRLGGKFGTATVVGITETGVVLKDQEGTRRLRLFPAVEKRVADEHETPPRATRGRAPGNDTKGKP